MMDRIEFSAKMPGTLVDIPETVAFLPDTLPPSLEIDAELLRAVDRARGAISEFVGQARLVQDINLIMAPLSHREAVLSNRIEGTYTQMRDVLLYEADVTEAVRPQEGPLREVLNYLQALGLSMDWMGEGRPFGQSLVRSLHHQLLQGVRGQARHPGAYRAGDLYIGDHAEGIARARFVPPPAEQVQPLMDDLARFVEGPTVFGALVDCAIVHYQLETIHPFEDGNGRFGRLFVPIFLVIKGVLDRPMLYLSSYFDANRDQYIALLKRVSTQGAWRDWVFFFLEAVERESNDSRRRVERVLSLKADYDERVRFESKATILAINYIMAHPFASIGQIKQHAGVTYPTAKRAVETLQRLGILKPYGNVSGAQLWYAEELMRQVYEVDETVESS